MVSGHEADGTWQVGPLGSEMRVSGTQSLLSQVGGASVGEGTRFPADLELGRGQTSRGSFWALSHTPSVVRRPHRSGCLGLGGRVGSTGYLLEMPSPGLNVQGSSEAGSCPSALGLLRGLVFGPFVEEGGKQEESSDF